MNTFTEEMKREFYSQFTDGVDSENDYYDSQFTEGRPSRVFDFMLSKFKAYQSHLLSEGTNLIKEAKTVRQFMQKSEWSDAITTYQAIIRGEQ